MWLVLVLFTGPLCIFVCVCVQPLLWWLLIICFYQWMPSGLSPRISVSVSAPNIKTTVIKGKNKILKCTSDRKNAQKRHLFHFFPTKNAPARVHVLHYPHQSISGFEVSVKALVVWTSMAEASQRLWGCRHSKSQFDGNPICSQLTGTVHSRVYTSLARWCFLKTLWRGFGICICFIAICRGLKEQLV